MSAHAATILITMGILTASAVVFVFVPGPAVKRAFGDDVPDAFTTTIARHWGLLVALVGGLLILARDKVFELLRRYLENRAG